MLNIIGVFFGLMAMLGWGLADFFVAVALKKRADGEKLYFWTQLLGLIPIVALGYFFFSWPIISAATIVLVLAAGFATVVEYVFMYKAFNVGKISLISPICAAYPLITVILSILFLGERLTAQQSLAILSIIAGIILVTLDFGELKKSRISYSTKGLMFAFVSLTASGILFAILGYLVKTMGWFMPILLMKFLAIAYLFPFIKLNHKDLSLGVKGIAWIVLLVASLEVFAFLSYGIGAEGFLNSIVVPISATYPLITIVLAKIFFKEKVKASQYAGILLVFVGLLLAL